MSSNNIKKIVLLLILLFPSSTYGAAASSTKKILQNVPFTSQAPYGDWKDLRQEDGCEEASSLMAVKWAKREKLTRSEALNEITSASDYIFKKYKEYRDVSLTDTLNWLIKDYFNYQKATVKKNISLTEMISELNKGNLIIAPMNGQLLKNKNYTPPGPSTHMILIRGYDQSKKIFITNDSGTRHGEMYEYDAKLFYSAIRAYPTGNHEKIIKTDKNVIVIWR